MKHTLNIGHPKMCRFIIMKLHKTNWDVVLSLLHMPKTRKICIFSKINRCKSKFKKQVNHRMTVDLWRAALLEIIWLAKISRRSTMICRCYISIRWRPVDWTAIFHHSSPWWTWNWPLLIVTKTLWNQKIKRSPSLHPKDCSPLCKKCSFNNILQKKKRKNPKSPQKVTKTCAFLKKVLGLIRLSKTARLNMSILRRKNKIIGGWP